MFIKDGEDEGWGVSVERGERMLAVVEETEYNFWSKIKKHGEN